MKNKNLDKQLNTKQKLENNKTNNYHRCSSVEEKYNNPCFSKDLEKEYLDIKHLVKNSVEKINVLFNNEEFKQKTTKKNIQNNINTININKFNFNKHDSSFDLLKKEDEKTDNIFQVTNNDNMKIKNAQINNNYDRETEENKYNNDDVYEELKEIENKKVKAINKNIKKFFQIKQKNSIETDNKALLNLESNKLYRNKDQTQKLKKLNITNPIKTDKKQKNIYISNYLKTARHQDIIHYKEKKIETLKFIQKGKVNNNNKEKKIERNSNNILKPRNSNNSTFIYDKNLERNNKGGYKELKSKYKNNSFKKDNSFYLKNNHNNSMKNDMDINMQLNNDKSCTTLNYNIFKDDKIVKNEKDIILSINNHLYKGEKREIDLKKIINEFKLQNNKIINDEKKIKSKQKKLKANLTLTSLNKESPSKFINKSNSKNKFEKISTQNFLKMMLMLNQYLINNNLINDYSNPDNKKILDEFSHFLNKNIKSKNANKCDLDDYIIDSGLKTERIIKKENSLINNINDEIKNNQININKNKCKNKTANTNINLNQVFNNIINKYNIIIQNNSK